MANTDINVRLVDETKAGFRQINQNLKGLQGQTSSLTGGFLKLGAAIAGSFAVKGIVETASKFQDLRTSLSLLLKDADAGAKAFDNIKSFATKSIFSVEQLTEAYIKLKAAGIEPTNKLLNTFQDTAALSADSLGALQAITDLFARTTAGGLGLEELNRLADRGIPVFDILTDKLKLTRLQVSEVGKSAEGSQRILNALVEGLNERFGGAVEGRLKNVSQAFNNLGDSIDNASDAIGEGGLNDALAKAAKTISAFVDANKSAFEEFGRILGGVIMLIVDNIQVLTAAFVGFFSVVAVSTIIRIAQAFATLNSVLGKNILLKIASGALALGTGIATYFALGADSAKELTKEAEKAGEAVSNVASTSAGDVAAVLKMQTAGLTAELDGLVAKYNLNNEALKTKLALETESISKSQDQIKLAQLTGEAEEKLAEQLANIEQKRRKIENEQGKGAEYRAEALRQLDDAQAKIIASNESYKDSLKELVDANKKALEVEKLREYSMDRQVELQRQVRDVQDEIAKVTMTDIEKKHYDIEAAARESAEAQIAEYMRLNKVARDAVPREIVEEYYEEAFKGVEKLKQVHQEHYEISRTWETGWERAFKKYVENATDASKAAERVFNTTVVGMEDMLLKFVKSGKLNWKDFVQSVVDELLKAQIAKLIADVFGGIGDMFGGGSKSSGGGGFLGGLLGGIGSAIGGLFGGFFAQGGYLPGGKFGIAGENGPELITGPANITPMNGMGGTVTYNINAVDARSFQELLARDPQSLYALTERGRMTMAGAR